MTKLIFDTDIGGDIDDALTLAMAVNSAGLDLLGVTVVYDDVAMKARLAAKILSTAGRPDIPVFMGEASPPVEPLICDKIKAQGGALDSTEEFPAIEQLPAVDFIGQACCKYPGEITILAIGALTNIAKALKTYPDMRKQVREIVLMGCAWDKDFAECNILVDPESAAQVMSAGLPLRVMPIDITEKCQVSEEFLETMRGEERPLQNLLARLIFLWQTGYSLGTPTLHDPLALGLLTAPELFEMRAVDIQVLLAPSEKRGLTCCQPNPNASIEICMGVDYDQFRNHFYSLILADHPILAAK